MTKSPWIKAWFNVGNVLLCGYPQDWIRALGKSIGQPRRRHVDWPAVRAAFAEIGYAGSVIAEPEPGD